jgi:hypothetical protein
VYGPCTADEKVNFTNWLYNYDSLEMWLVMGGFNLIRCPENRNRPSGNVNEMLLFNDVISHLDLVEVPLKSRAFTWSNMQSNFLQEKLDWIFTSPYFFKHFGICNFACHLGSCALCGSDGFNDAKIEYIEV